MIIKLPPTVETLLNTLTKAGFIAGVVGGCVRDSIMGRTPHDYDISTNAKPEEIESIFTKEGYKTLSIGKAFGIITVVVEGECFEIATFRKEQGTLDGRHPETINFVDSVTDDLSRRDFSCNAMFYSPTLGLIDPCDGQADIENGILHFVGYAVDRILEDRLRMLRAFRFCSQLGFFMSPMTIEGIEKVIKQGDPLQGVSQERITQEFSKILLGKDVVGVLGQMEQCGLLKEIIPEIQDLVDCPQSPPYHTEGPTVWHHTLKVVESAAKRSKDLPDEDRLTIMLTALLHDIGKLKTLTTKEVDNE